MARSTTTTIIIDADASRAKTQIITTQGLLLKLGNSVDKLGKKVGRQGRIVERNSQKQVKGWQRVYGEARKYFYVVETGRRIIQMFAMAVIRPLGEAQQAAIDFGKAIAEISTLYGKDIANGQLRVEKLTNTVKDLAFQYGKSPVDQAKALYFAISAGALEAKDAVELLRVTNLLATAGMVSAEVATRSLTTVINAFKRPWAEAEKIADLFFITVQKGVTTIGELAPKMGRVASMAAVTNMSMETMFALIAAGTKAIGRTPYTITGLAAAIKNILSPTKRLRRNGID